MNLIQGKLIQRVASLATRNVYGFSKNPFEKFNRNKKTPTQQNKHEDSDHKHHKDNLQHPQTTEKDKTTEKQPEKMQTDNNEQPNQTQRSSSFSKFRSHRSKTDHSTQPEAKESHPQPNQQHQEPKPAHQAKGFQRFLRNKHPQQTAETSEKPATPPPEPDPKKKEIPKIKLEYKPGQQDELESLRLRKPKSSFRNRAQSSLYKQEEPKTEEKTTNFAAKDSQQPSKQQQKEEAPEPEGKHPEDSKWQNFKMLIEAVKQRARLTQTPRFSRLSLFKEEESAGGKQQQAKGPTDFRRVFLQLIAGGVALVATYSLEKVGINHDKEVSPEYLQQALQKGYVQQTWIGNVQMEANNDESVKGKNIHKFIYIRESNGDISYCVSNSEFERQWLNRVLAHNHQISIKTPDLYHTATGQMVSKSAVPPKQVKIGERSQGRDTSKISYTRNILSLVLLYYFIKSITQMGRGARPKGGKGISSMLEQEKSYRLKQAMKVTFQDVVGMQKAKEQIVQFIDFLKTPEKYHKLGARIPKGALLTGPPGTGKTMLAKACAGESNVPFFTISGSEFIEMYVGVGAQRVRSLFQEAKASAPSIIFVDEIDAVGKKRTGGMGGGGNDERDTTLNQLLVEMDGFDNQTSVIVFAATNQKEVLDPALMRPGRFDRLIDVDLPDLEGRCEIFEVHLKPLVLDKNIDPKDYAKRLATLTPGFSGADIKNICNEAAIIAARNNKESISILDFELATERIIGGVEKKSQLITQETRKTVAYHECGHGVVSWFLQHASPLLKLTIIPRSKGALGFAQYLPNEHQIYTSAKLMDQICVILGGRVAEEQFFGRISTGASDDLNKAYQVAKTLVTQYGFAESLGWLQYNETQYAKEYSKDIEDKIDTQIMNIMKVCSDRTRQIIIQKKEIIAQLAEKLLTLQTIDQTVIEEILGERPYGLSKQHKEYIKQKKRISEDIKAQQVAQTKTPQTQGITKLNRSEYLL